MKNIMFIAPPAAGKGTQAELVVEKYNIPHISTGDILREIAKQDSEIGKYVQETLASGGLVKDDITYQLIEDRLKKDDCKNGSKGITGEWGNGFYAESDNCVDFEIPSEPTVYTREVTWEDGRVTKQGNLERPSVLFDENGKPTHIFCASGNGKHPYVFNERTFIVCMKLEEK